MTPYAKLLVSRNGGPWASGGVVCARGDAVQFGAESTVAHKTQRYEVYEYPLGFTAPQGWSTEPSSGVVFYEGFSPPPWTIPLWGKYLLALKVNDLVPASNLRLYDTDTGLNLRSPEGLEDIAHTEEGLFDAARKWIGPLQRNLRALEARLGGFVVDALTADADRALITAASERRTIKVTSTLPLTAARVYLLPAVQGRCYVVRNATTGGQALTVKTLQGAGVVVPNGEARALVSDGTDYMLAEGAGASPAAGDPTKGFARTELAHATTTDATPVDALVFVVPDNASVSLAAKAIAHRADHQASRYLARVAGFRNTGGVIAALAAPPPTGDGDAAAAGLELLLVATGASVKLQAKGLAAQTFRWSVAWELLVVRGA